MGIRRHELSHSQWERIAPMLPGKASDPGRTAADDRLFVNAVLWVLRCGNATLQYQLHRLERELPAELPSLHHYAPVPKTTYLDVHETGCSSLPADARAPVSVRCSGDGE